MLSASPRQESGGGDGEHGEHRRRMGREGMQALKSSALWDTSESRCGFSLECFLQVMEGTTAQKTDLGRATT